MKKDIWDSIKSFNKAFRVKICRCLSRSTGHYILYLEYTHNGNRQRWYPGMYLFLDEAHRAHDELTMRRIMLLREEKDRAILGGGTLTSFTPQVHFVDYANKVISGKKANNRRGYGNAISSFSKVYPHLAVSDLTLRHVCKYAESIAHLSPCSINHYYVALRHVCAQAVRDGLLQTNPFAGLSVKRHAAIKNFLTIEELEAAMSTPCRNPVVKDAFIFSCFTGLRLGDIATISSEQVRDGYLYFTQSKTGSQERILLPEVAARIADVEGKIFRHPAAHAGNEYLYCF